MEESKTHNTNKHKTEKLNLGSLFFGSILIVVGLLYLAQSSGFVALPFSGLAYNWPVFVLPLIIMFVGLSMLRASNPFAKALGVLFVFLLVALLSCVFFFGRMGYNYGGYFMGGFRMPYYGNIENIDNGNYYQTNGFPMMFRGLR